MTETLTAPEGHNSDVTLATCAASIRTIVAKQNAAAGDNLLAGIEIGRLIEEARRIVGGGAALYGWVEREAGVKQRQAKTYMALAANEAAIRAAVAWSREPGVEVEPRLLRLENAKKLVALHKQVQAGEPTQSPAKSPSRISCGTAEAA